jgi:ketosteroid isomerase-like protein
MTTSPMSVTPKAVDAHAFAVAWIAAWNAHDLERIVAHYADEIVLTTPRAAVVVPSSGGVIRGKAALRAYWAEALTRAPKLRFELDDALTTVGGVTLLYRNHRGERAAETCVWNDHGLVTQCWVAYASAPRGSMHALIARVPAAAVPDFAAYEAAVLPVLGRHGGRLERRLRTADGTVEIHLVRFADPGQLEAFRVDPERIAAQPWLVASGATVELVVVDDLPLT